MAAQLIRVFHEEQDFGFRILGASDLHFKEKECEVPNSAVINNKILSSVLPNSSGKKCLRMQNYFMLCDILLAHGPLRARHGIGGLGAELRTGAVFHKLSYQDN